jgi:type IV pilus assembly protein PilE
MMRQPIRMRAQMGPGQAAGFTLIELMIAVVVVSILLAIAVPSYETYVQKSRRTDAKTALLDLATREQRYFSVNNTFTASFGDLGYAAAGTSPASVEVGSDYYQVSVSVPAAAPDPNAANVAAPSFSFTATPVAGTTQANDTDCAAFEVDSSGYQAAQNSAQADNTTNCWQ